MLSQSTIARRVSLTHNRVRSQCGKGYEEILPEHYHEIRLAAKLARVNRKGGVVLSGKNLEMMVEAGLVVNSLQPIKLVPNNKKLLTTGTKQSYQNSLGPTGEAPVVQYDTKAQNQEEESRRAMTELKTQQGIKPE
jgi:hypothetical protein